MKYREEKNLKETIKTIINEARVPWSEIEKRRKELPDRPLYDGSGAPTDSEGNRPWDPGFNPKFDSTQQPFRKTPKLQGSGGQKMPPLLPSLGNPNAKKPSSSEPLIPPYIKSPKPQGSGDSTTNPKPYGTNPYGIGTPLRSKPENSRRFIDTLNRRRGTLLSKNPKPTTTRPTTIRPEDQPKYNY